MTDAPLVYTSKGNVLESSLEYFNRWEDTPEYTKFVWGYRLNGEVVKESAHVLAKRGISSEALQQALV